MNFLLAPPIGTVATIATEVEVGLERAAMGNRASAPQMADAAPLAADVAEALRGAISCGRLSHHQ